jgi:hypothetical protein
MNSFAVHHDVDAVADIAVGQTLGRDPVLGDLLARP